MTVTSPAIRPLLARLIDYAGLFPPAKLDMGATVGNYARYLAGGDAWMLGRLILPVERLDEFEQVALQALRQSAADETGPWQLSVIAAPAGSEELEADLVRIAAFNQKHEDDEAGLAVIETIELGGESVQVIESALDQITGDLFPCFEIAIDDDPRSLIAALADGDCAAKVRLGGPNPEAVPSTANLARFIHAAATTNVPFKATAGLHHPLRRRAEALGADEHGFLNVFTAACLAQTDLLSEADIAALLEERSLDAFRIGEDVMQWRKHRLGDDSIEDVREEFALSFGSCSFDEPRQRLRELGLIEPAVLGVR